MKPEAYTYTWEYLNNKTSRIDLADFGTREVPIENIELAYKDIEKLAKLGYGDENFLDEVMFKKSKSSDKIPNWPQNVWDILPSGKLYTIPHSFRRFGPYHDSGAPVTLEEYTAFPRECLKDEKDPDNIKELQEMLKKETENFYNFKKFRDKELEPGFVEKYLKAWKEEMIKVNKLGIDRYRYEKYGRTH